MIIRRSLDRLVRLFYAHSTIHSRIPIREIREIRGDRKDRSQPQITRSTRIACGRHPTTAHDGPPSTALRMLRCAPSEPVNILHIHGTADDIDSYAAGAFTIGGPFPANMPPYPGAVQTVQTWAGYNGAHDPVTDPTPSMDLALDVAGLDTVVTRYLDHPPGGAVELWTITGGPHTPTWSSEFAPRLFDWLLAHPKP